MSNTPSLTLKSTLSSPIIPVTGEPHLIYMLLEVTGGKGKGSLPVNIGLIIDSSDSMRIRLVTNDQFAQLAQDGYAQEVMTDGVPAFQISCVPGDLIKDFPRRIDYVSEALAIASEFLRPVDRYSLTAFAERAVMLIPSSPGNERNRLNQAARELEYLKLGDGTNMAAGIASAFNEIQKQSSDRYANRLILLTDGHTRNVKDCYSWARRAQEVGLALTTMGVGSEFNEELLIPLADLTGGNAYYIESPDQIPDVFREELGVALRVSYRNVEVKMQLPSEVDLRRVYRVLPELGTFEQGARDNGDYRMGLGSYDPASPTALLLELIIPGWGAGTYRMARTELSWEDPDSTVAPEVESNDILIQLAENSASPKNERVLNIIERVGAYIFGTRALEDAQNSADKTAATARLRQAAARLENIGEKSLADAMSQQAQALEREGSVDPNTTKKLRYETRRLVGHQTNVKR